MCTFIAGTKQKRKRANIDQALLGLALHIFSLLIMSIKVCTGKTVISILQMRILTERLSNVSKITCLEMVSYVLFRKTTCASGHHVTSVILFKNTNIHSPSIL